MDSGIFVTKRAHGRKDDKYFVPIIWKAIYLMECIHSDQEGLTLQDIVKKTGIPHTTAFRILHTLIEAEQISKRGHLYRSPRKLVLAPGKERPTVQ